MNETEGSPAAPAKKGMSTGGKWGLGCGIGCLVIVFGMMVAGFLGYRWVMTQYEGWLAEFEEKGFKKVSSQMLTITEAPSEPTVYVAQTVKIDADVDVEIALICQMAELSGTYSKKVYFRGQMLTVKPNGHLEGDLDVTCQLIQNFGEIDGEVTGKYQSKLGK